MIAVSSLPVGNGSLSMTLRGFPSYGAYATCDTQSYGCSRHQAAKQSAVMAGFGVPQHAQQKTALRIFYCFDRSVERPCGRRQSSRRLHALMVIGQHLGLPAENVSNSAIWVNRHIMTRVFAKDGAMLVVADHVGKMLNQRAAMGDTEQLHATTDSEDRKIAIDGGIEQRQLGLVPIRVAATRARSRVCSPYAPRIDVRTPREDQRVEAFGELRSRQWRQQHGNAAPAAATCST